VVLAAKGEPMKKMMILAIVGTGLLCSACAGRAGPAQTAGAGVRPVNGTHPTGFFHNGISSNSAGLGAVTLDGVEVVGGKLVRR
jgi:hypothetical protein